MKPAVKAARDAPDDAEEQLQGFVAVATVALVLLLLPTVRRQFGHGRGLETVASSPAA